MMTRLSGPGLRRDAPALRFLLLCLGGWVLFRILMVWGASMPPPGDATRPSWAGPRPFTVIAVPARAGHRTPQAASSHAPAGRRWPSAPAVQAGAQDAGLAAVGDGGDRHRLRLAMMAHFLPSARVPGQGYAPANKALWPTTPAAVQAEPGRGQPFWMQRNLSGWSASGWVYLRGGRDAPAGIAAASQLGASQAGLRLVHGFGGSGRLRAYARADIALNRLQQRELALGLAFAPAARWPVDVAVERRTALGSEGRDALAAMVTGGLSDLPLPHGFQLDAYGQVGVVGVRRRDAFADGALVVDRHIGEDAEAPLRLGALAAGAAQSGAARVDVGPRLTVRLPDVGEGGRLALDWRQRVAGKARPESGVALTLAADF